MKDPIVAEIHKYREERARKFIYDLDGICEDLHAMQRETGLKVVRLPPKTARNEKEGLTKMYLTPARFLVGWEAREVVYVVILRRNDDSLWVRRPMLLRGADYVGDVRWSTRRTVRGRS